MASYTAEYFITSRKEMAEAIVRRPNGPYSDIGAGSVLFVCALHLLFTSPSTIFPPIIPADQALSEGQSRALVYAFSGFPQKGDLTFTALPVDGGNLDFSSHRRRVGSLVKSFRSLNWRLYAALLVKQAMPTVSGRRLEVMLMF